MPLRRKRFAARRRPRLRKAAGGMRRTSAAKRRKFGKASSVVIRQPSGVADRIFVKLVYREQLTFTQAAGVLGYNIYSLNSLFDPNITGTGAQPYFFDQWSTLYTNYIVHGAKVVVTSSVNDVTFNNIQGLTFSASSTAFSSIEQAVEQPYVKKKSLIMGSSASGQSTVKGYMSIAKLYGRGRKETSINPNLRAAVTASPSTQMVVHVWNYVPGGATQSLLADVNITYFAEFFNRARPATS